MSRCTQFCHLFLPMVSPNPAVYFSMEETIFVLVLMIHFILCVYLYKFEVDHDSKFPICWFLYIKFILCLPVNSYIHWNPMMYPATPLPMSEKDTLFNTNYIIRGGINPRILVLFSKNLSINVYHHALWLGLFIWRFWAKIPYELHM